MPPIWNRLQNEPMHEAFQRSPGVATEVVAREGMRVSFS